MNPSEILSHIISLVENDFHSITLISTPKPTSFPSHFLPYLNNSHSYISMILSIPSYTLILPHIWLVIPSFIPLNSIINLAYFIFFSPLFLTLTFLRYTSLNGLSIPPVKFHLSLNMCNMEKHI